MEGWSNQACKGYAIKAAERIGMKEEEIQKLINAMRYEHDMITIREAEQVYRESQY